MEFCSTYGHDITQKMRGVKVEQILKGILLQSDQMIQSFRLFGVLFGEIDDHDTGIFQLDASSEIRKNTWI